MSKKAASLQRRCTRLRRESRKMAQGCRTGACCVASHCYPFLGCSCCQPRYVADVKLGLPVPEGFWACLLPEISTPASVFASEGRRLLSHDLRPECRSRPVRVFGVCAGSRKARQSFVWEVRYLQQASSCLSGLPVSPSELSTTSCSLGTHLVHGDGRYLENLGRGVSGVSSGWVWYSCASNCTCAPVVSVIFLEPP